MTWIVLTPDAQYDDDGELERAAGGDALAFSIFHSGAGAKADAGALASADALLVWHEEQVDADYIASLGACRIIVRAGVGFDNIDVAAAGRAGIPVCNTPDYGTGEVADHAMAMLLALERQLPALGAAIAADPAGGFDYRMAPLPRRLRGRTMAIIGAGRIGTAMALRAMAFGYRVVLYDPFLPAGQEIALGVTRPSSLEALLAEADVVSLHAPLTEKTHRMFGAKLLAACKQGAILLNTARGPIIDIDALHDALRNGQLRAAGLDVLPEEPPATSQLPRLLAAYAANESWLAGRLILTPHSAWSSVESCRDAREKSVETIRLFLTAGELRNCVKSRVAAQVRKPPSSNEYLGMSKRLKTDAAAPGRTRPPRRSLPSQSTAIAFQKEVGE